MASKTDKKWAFLLEAIVMVSSSSIDGFQASPIPGAERRLPGNEINSVGSSVDPNVALAVDFFIDDFKLFCLDRQGREQNMAANGFEQKSEGYSATRLIVVNFGPSTSNSGGEAKELVATPGQHFLDRFGNFPTIAEMLKNGKATVVLTSGGLTENTAERIVWSAETAHLFEEAQSVDTNSMEVRAA